MRPLSENVSLAERVADALEARLAAAGLNSRRLRAVRSPPRSPPCAPACPAARPAGAAKTMLSTAPCSDANWDSIRSVAFCVSDPGISNSSRRRAADRPDEDDEHDDDADPADDHTPRVGRAGPRPARERARRHPLVCGQSAVRLLPSRQLPRRPPSSRARSCPSAGMLMSADRAVPGNSSVSARSHGPLTATVGRPTVSRVR